MQCVRTFYILSCLLLLVLPTTLKLNDLERELGRCRYSLHATVITPVSNVNVCLLINTEHLRYLSWHYMEFTLQ